MNRGIDTDQVTTGKVHDLNAAGASFIARYYGTTKVAEGLALTKAEALAISSVCDVVSVWESGFANKMEYYDGNQGIVDGTKAYRYARDVIGQPVDTSIYFAVDVDYPFTAGDNLQAYFQAVRLGFHQASCGSPIYLIGAYGSGHVLSNLFELGLVSYTWLAQSTGWSGSEDYNDWNIKQLPGATVAGLDVDWNETRGVGGGWRIK